MLRNILLFCIVLLALPFSVSAQEPEPRSVLSVEVCEDKPEKHKWELYGGTVITSAIVYPTGKVGYKGPVQKFWAGGEKRQSERLTFFIEAVAYKRLSSNHYHEGGDEAEVLVGLKGEQKEWGYEGSFGYRKSRGEEDLVLFEGKVEGPAKAFGENRALRPFARFAVEIPANSAGHHKAGVVGGGLSYLHIFPSKSFFVETSFAVLGGTGIDHHDNLRTDLLVVFGKWKGSNLKHSKLAVKPFVRLTDTYFSGGVGFFFGKVR